LRRIPLTIYHSQVNQKLKIFLTGLSGILVLTLSLPALAQRKDDVTTTSFSSAPYRVGERLTYDVSFSSFVSAAHVELLVAARGTFFGRDAVQVRAHVETSGVVNAALYAVNNDYTAYVDPNTGQPFRTQEVRREASHTSDSSSEYNQPAGTSAIPQKLRRGEFPGTYDLVSALYRVRALPLVEGSSYYITVRTDSSEYQAQLRVSGREMIKTSVGSFNTIVAQLSVKNSELNGYRIRIHFSDDERHVPVLITAHHPAGEIRAELAGAELLRPAPATKTKPATPIAPVQPPKSSPPGTDSSNPASGLSPDLPFQVGEQLNFQVYLASVQQPVGTANFQVRQRGQYFGRDGLLLSASAQTSNAAQKLFVANDQINSYVDPSTLLPFRTEMALVEGRHRVNQTLSFDQDRGSATVDGRHVEIPVGTHDFISILYAARAFDLSPPKRNAVSVFIHNRPRTLFITSLRREIIELGGQRVPAVQVSLTTDDPQVDKFLLRGWVSDDGRRLPLRLTAVTELGPVRADLVIVPVTQQ
jgi:hypothetical protein